MEAETAVARTQSESGRDTAHIVERRLDGAWLLVDAAGSRARASLAAARAMDAVARALERSTGAQSIPDRLRRAVEAANATVFEEELPAPACLTYATSVVRAAISDERLLLAHAGNARCYQFRAGNRALLTRPHTAVAALELDESTVFATHHRHFVTRALGIARCVDPELSEHVLRQGDLLVFVNDSLSRLVEQRDVADLPVRRARVATVASAIARLGEQHGIDGVIIALEISTANSHPLDEPEEAQ